MPNVNKKLTSQAHAASQVNVKPTKKANSSTAVNNQKKPPVKRPAKEFYGGTTYRKNPLYAEGILLNDYNREFIAGIDFKDWPNVDLQKIPQPFIDQVIKDHYKNINPLKLQHIEYLGYLTNQLNQQNDTITALKKSLESKDTKHSAGQFATGEKSQAAAEPADKLKLDHLQLQKRLSKTYTVKGIDSIEPNVIVKYFNDIVMYGFDDDNISTGYMKGFMELSTDISMLWDNLTFNKLPYSFYHISESMQLLTSLQFFIKDYIECEGFDTIESSSNKFFTENLFRCGLLDESIEKNIKTICEGLIIIKDALYVNFGSHCSDINDEFKFFHRLYDFYTKCNDYLLNLENN